MRNTFKLTFLAAALAMAGCSSQSKPVELPTVPPPSQYDSRIQDSLGAQKYTEAQIIAQRKFNEFQSQLDDLEQKRLELDSAMNARAYEEGLSEAPGSTAEARRIQEYQDATRSSQAKVAQASSDLSIKQALIENRRDQELLSAERDHARRLSSLEDRLADRLSKQEEQLRKDIDGYRIIDRAVQQQASAQFEEQRFTIAVANAESERLANARLDEEVVKLSQIQAEALARVSKEEARIDVLRRQIAAAEQGVIEMKARNAVQIAGQQSRVDAATTEVKRFATIAQQLKATALPAGLASSQPSSEILHAKESALSQLKADAAVQKEREVAKLEALLAEEKAQIIARARSEIASLSATVEMAKATVVAPVVTGRAVYTGDKAQTQKPTPVQVEKASPAPKPQAAVPILTVNRFEPKVNDRSTVPSSDELGGDVLAVGAGVSAPRAQATAAPLIVAARTRSVFDVYYVYRDKDTWVKFQNYLKAYGISDFEPSHKNATGEFLIYCGRYYDEEQAASRVSFLNSKTNTDHVQVRETQVPL